MGAARGCVIEFWIGAAVGAVGVAGGAENVRMPWLPPEKPPPARAFVSAVTSTSAAVIAASAISPVAMGRRAPLAAGFAGGFSGDRGSGGLAATDAGTRGGGAA
jgi:hypothetical protein